MDPNASPPNVSGENRHAALVRAGRPAARANLEA
jgi:hypothetical protein